MAKKGNGEGSIYSTVRNGKKYYRGQVTVGLDEEGKQIRKTVSGYNRSQVIKNMREMQVQLDRGIFLNDGNIKLEDYFHAWIFDYKKLEVSQSSFQCYEAEYRLRIKGTKIGRMAIKDIRNAYLQNYFSDLLDSGMSVNTVKRLNMYLKACFKHAIEIDKILYNNPCTGVRLPTIRKNRKRRDSVKVFTDTEQRSIISALEFKNTTHLLIYVGFATGMRIGEIRGLQWDQVLDDEIFIDRQFRKIAEIDRNGNRTWTYQVSETKTEESERYVPIPKQVMKELKKHKIRQKEIRLYMGKNFKDENFVFADEYGFPINDKKINRTLQSICRDLGIQELSFHALRHSYATRLFEANIPAKTVSKLLGHSDPTITYQTYTHVLEKSLKGIDDVIQNAL